MHKHMVLQNAIVNDVYMGGSPSLVEVRRDQNIAFCGCFMLCL
jgi:hypothetical protein